MDNYKNELDELQKLYAKAGTEAQKLAAPLMNEAAFQAKQLERLRADIEKDGWIAKYYHGNHQSGTTQSASGKSYLALAKCFNTTVKTLFGVLDGKMPEPPSEIKKFLNRETR